MGDVRDVGVRRVCGGGEEGVWRGCGGGVESDKGNFTDWTPISLERAPSYLLQEKQQQEGHEGHLVHFE